MSEWIDGAKRKTKEKKNVQGAFAFTGRAVLMCIPFVWWNFFNKTFLNSNLIHLRFVGSWNVEASSYLCHWRIFVYLTTRHWIRHFWWLWCWKKSFQLTKSIPHAYRSGQLAIFREHCITHSLMDFDNSFELLSFFSIIAATEKFSLSISTCFFYNAFLKVFFSRTVC